MLACLGGNKLKILKGPYWVMFIVDSDFRDKHKKVLMIARLSHKFWLSHNKWIPIWSSTNGLLTNKMGESELKKAEWQSLRKEASKYRHNSIIVKKIKNKRKEMVLPKTKHW